VTWLQQWKLNWLLHRGPEQIGTCYLSFHLKPTKAISNEVVDKDIWVLLWGSHWEDIHLLHLLLWFALVCCQNRYYFMTSLFLEGYYRVIEQWKWKQELTSINPLGWWMLNTQAEWFKNNPLGGNVSVWISFGFSCSENRAFFFFFFTLLFRIIPSDLLVGWPYITSKFWKTLYCLNSLWLSLWHRVQLVICL